MPPFPRGQPAPSQRLTQLVSMYNKQFKQLCCTSCQETGFSSSCCCLPSYPGTQPVKVAQEHRGVVKRQPSSPARSCFKAMAKSTSKADCYAQLKNLLPNARQSESTSEVSYYLHDYQIACMFVSQCCCEAIAKLKILASTNNFLCFI